MKTNRYFLTVDLEQKKNTTEIIVGWLLDVKSQRLYIYNKIIFKFLSNCYFLFRKKKPSFPLKLFLLKMSLPGHVNDFKRYN